MKQHITLLLCCVLLLGTLTACTAAKDGSAITDAYFTGTVTEVRSTSYLLQVTDDGNGQFGIGNPVIVHVQGTPVYAVGDSLLVEFDGIVAKSYPPQIPGVTSISKVN